MKPSTFICGWASLPEARPRSANEPVSQTPTFLLLAASDSPAQAASAKRILLYLYCLVIYLHMTRKH